VILLAVSFIMIVTEVGKKFSFKNTWEAATDTILACYVQRPFLHIWTMLTVRKPVWREREREKERERETEAEAAVPYLEWSN
jgi:hypothetical protein